MHQGGWLVAKGTLCKSHRRDFPGSRQSDKESGVVKGAVSLPYFSRLLSLLPTAWQGSRHLGQEALSASFQFGMGLAELALLTVPMSPILASERAVSEARARAGHRRPSPFAAWSEGLSQGLLAGQNSDSNCSSTHQQALLASPMGDGLC